MLWKVNTPLLMGPKEAEAYHNTPVWKALAATVVKQSIHTAKHIHRNLQVSIWSMKCTVE